MGLAEPVLRVVGERTVRVGRGELADIARKAMADEPEDRFRDAKEFQAALRGGVPVCWPQFNQRGPLPKHGFARNLPWHLQAFEPQGEGAVLTMALQSGERTLAHWAAGFEARGVVNLQPGRFQLTLSVRNTGAVAWSFTGALHSYLAVDGVSSAHLDGLGRRSRCARCCR